MRKIKFRAWDKTHKKMLVLEPFTGLGNFNHTDKWFFCDGYIDPDNDLSLEEVELMQYTGLKDKNGREIYEGDILSSRLTDYARIYDVQEAFEVIFDFGAFKLKGLKIVMTTEENSWHMLHDFPQEYEMEVIGNIYENPDLVKEK